MTDEPKRQRGGARPGAGRPRKQPVPVSATGDDPKAFLLALMQDAEADPRLRVDAAKALLRQEADGGKKQSQAKAAETASKGNYAAGAPPKFQVVK